jgi:RNA 2',3'-cyclic 3'-phosphodiesterase
MTEKIRAFIAIELPDEIRAGIGQAQAATRATGLRGAWVRPENIHLTLKFLGDIGSAEIETIAETIAEACKLYEPFQLTVRGMGVFPGADRPRVLWVGVGGQVDVLEKLQHSLAQQLAGCGYPDEKRRFSAHLTIARFKGSVATQVLLQAIQAQAAFETQAFVAREIILFQSVLKPSGAVYSPLRRVAL